MKNSCCHSNQSTMKYIRRNSQTVAVRAIRAGNSRLLERLLENGLIDPTSAVTITLGSQSSTSRLVCSNISGTRLEPEVCKCGLDTVVCKDYLQRAALLELSASCGQIRCCEVLLQYGADIYGPPDGTTAIIQILHQLRHVTPSNIHSRYTDTLRFLLQFVDPKVYTDRWRQLQQNSTGTQMYQMDLLYPVNLACTLQLPVELKMLIEAGFSVFYNQQNISYYRIDPFGLTLERTIEPNSSSIKCLNTLLEHTPDISSTFTAAHKMTLLNIVVKKQHHQHLQILLDNVLDPQLLREQRRGEELLIKVLSQRCGRNNCREMAKSLIEANCCDYTNGGTNISKTTVNTSGTISKYPTPLTLAILYHPSLVPTMLETGIRIWGQCRKVNPDGRDVSPWVREVKFRKLFTLLKEAEYSDFNLAKEYLDAETLRTFMLYAANEKEHTMSLLFHCRKTIRKQLVQCSKTKVETLNLPKGLKDYILLK